MHLTRGLPLSSLSPVTISWWEIGVGGSNGGDDGGVSNRSGDSGS